MSSSSNQPSSTVTATSPSPSLVSTTGNNAPVLDRAETNTSTNTSTNNSNGPARRSTTTTTRFVTNLAPNKSASTATPTLTRPRTLLERQPYMGVYGAAISLVSPAATAYQLCRLYKLTPSSSQLMRMSLTIFPHQTLLKVVQMNASTPVKEYCNPWMAFGMVGVLQGAVYGQANMHFANVLGIASKTTAVTVSPMATLSGMFRGSLFAGGRDMISQGLPFMGSSVIRTNVLDRVLPTTENDTTLNSIKHWTSLLSTSIVATYLSQGLHNLQITMQADATITYQQVIGRVWQQHGIAMLYKGAEARVGLLLIVNVLNELLLKPAWMPVPIEE